MSRALATLARLRKLEADEARRDLGEAVAHEMRAEAGAAQARKDRAQEAEAARDYLATEPAGPQATAYANWLPASAQAIAAAERDLAARHQQRTLAASGLIARRAALEAVSALIDTAEQVKRRQAARRAQHRLDELARQPGAFASSCPPNGAAPARQPR